MWDCESCGCQAIAGTLEFCPMCFKEREMPKNTVGGGYSDQYEPADPADDQDPDEAVPSVKDNSEHDPDRGNGPDPEQPELPFDGDVKVEGTVTVTPADQPEDSGVSGGYSNYSVRDLVELCKARGIAYSGPAGTLPKDVLAARLS